MNLNFPTSNGMSGQVEVTATSATDVVVMMVE